MLCHEGTAVADVEGGVPTGAACRSPHLLTLALCHTLWSDLCWVCQRNNAHILRAVNVPEDMKSATLLRQEEHLRLATTQRAAYQAMCAASVALAARHGITELGRSANPPATFHYSFDFTRNTQQINSSQAPSSSRCRERCNSLPCTLKGFHGRWIIW